MIRNRQEIQAVNEQTRSILAKSRIEQTIIAAFGLLAGDSLDSSRRETEHSRAGKKTRDFGLACKLRDRIIDRSAIRGSDHWGLRLESFAAVRIGALTLVQSVTRLETPEDVRGSFAPCAAKTSLFFTNSY